MPPKQSIQVTDRAATPVNFTLLPTSLSGKNLDVFRVAVADASGNLLSERSMTFRTIRAQGRFKTTIRLAYPIVVNETINGVQVPKVARTAYIDSTFNFPGDSTLQERNDAVGMFASAMAVNKPLFHDTVVKGEGIY